MKITQRRLKAIIKEELSRMKESGLAGHYTEPRHEGGTPEERLLNKLLIRSKIDKAGDPQRAAEMLGLGEDEEVIAYLANLMGNPMLDNPNMEEGARQGHYTASEPLERMSSSTMPVDSYSREELEQALAEIPQLENPKYARGLPAHIPQWIEDVKKRAAEEGIQ